MNLKEVWKFEISWQVQVTLNRLKGISPVIFNGGFKSEYLHQLQEHIETSLPAAKVQA